MRSLFLLFALTSVSGPAVAQVTVDTSEVVLRPVPSAVEAYRADPRFDYERERVEPRNPLSRFWEWLVDRLLQPTLSALPPRVLTYGLYVLLALVLGLAVYQLATSRRQTITARGERRHLDDELRAVGIEAVDLRRWLREADGAGDHRESVRIRYLIVLQHLAAAGEIDWRTDKTNRAYLAEMAGHHLVTPFVEVTELFEQVWYGNRPAGPAEVQVAQDLLDQITTSHETEVPA